MNEDQDETQDAGCSSSRRRGLQVLVARRNGDTYLLDDEMVITYSFLPSKYNDLCNVTPRDLALEVRRILHG